MYEANNCCPHLCLTSTSFKLVYNEEEKLLTILREVELYVVNIQIKILFPTNKYKVVAGGDCPTTMKIIDIKAIDVFRGPKKLNIELIGKIWKLWNQNQWFIHGNEENLCFSTHLPWGGKCLKLLNLK